MVAELPDWEHVSRLLMVSLCAGIAGFWWRQLQWTLRFAIRWTVAATATLCGVSVYLSLAYLVLLFDLDHSAETGLWLRPAAAVYFVASCWRTWLFRPIVDGVLNFRDEVDRNVNR